MARKLIIKGMHITEKTNVLQNLVQATSNPSVSKCDRAKYVFLVDLTANKYEIREAIEEMYSDMKIKVASVNTIRHPGKARRVRGKKGRTARFKKAIVTLKSGDFIDTTI